MTQIATGNLPPAVERIGDRLDAIGRKHRAQQLLSGAMRWAMTVALATFVAAMAAHFAGAGSVAKCLLIAWIAVVGGATWRWLLRPLLVRPDPAAIARLVERRMHGLHNGLTNALQLSQRPDIAANPWLPEVYDEILRDLERRPLGSAVRIADLRPLLIRTLVVLLAAATLAAVLRGRLVHGWQQLLGPSAFVPTTGDVRLVSLQPGAIQMVLGKPLDVMVVAEGPRSLGQPPMTIRFEPLSEDPTSVLPLPADSSVLPASVQDLDGDQASFRYVYRLDRLERSLRYRIEVAGTQSERFAATVIRQVRLQHLSITITPPAYLRELSQTVGMTAAEIGQKPVAAPEGSTIQLSATLDVPVEGAILQLGDAAALAEARSIGSERQTAATAIAPIGMTSSHSGRQFSAGFTLVGDTPIVILLTDSAGQAMFSVPEERLVITAVQDAPPTIEMKWPKQDLVVAPADALRVEAMLKDDRGLARGVIRVGIDTPSSAAAPAGEMTPIAEQTFGPGDSQGTVSAKIEIPAAARVSGTLIRVQVEASDNRDLGPSAAKAWKDLSPDGDVAAKVGGQTTRSPVYQVRLEDPAQVQQRSVEQADALRKLLSEMLQRQQSLHRDALLASRQPPGPAVGAIAEGQAALRSAMRQTADTFAFAERDQIVQKTLLMLAMEPGRDAEELAEMLRSEPAADARKLLWSDLHSRQRRIIAALDSLLAVLNRADEPATRPSQQRSDDLAGRGDELRKLDEALQTYIAQQQRILDQTVSLAKKPVHSFDDADRKLLQELAMAQGKLDAFMQQKVRDVSKLVEQDMANASLLSELMEAYAEVTLARDALQKQAIEVAVAAEENGVQLAREIRTNLEKWLSDKPDRVKWTQEDPPEKNYLPLAELPKELEDLIGELLEQEEDLFDALEDADANWHGSADESVGWETLDGPISNMTAKGVTGNQLPNNNQMTGRSGEGRSGQSQGEFVEDTASGKGGRRTPTRLDPTEFQRGQVKDKSTDPTGGASGGGKLSGQGAQGLEGPVPPQQKEVLQRLAQKQAQIRSTAERLNLQHRLGRFDNFKLLESVALMRRVEADLNANRYQTALRRRQVLLESLDTSRLLLGSAVHVSQDTTPTGRNKQRKEVGDAMKGELPPAWKDALKSYYQKLADE